MKLGSVMKNIVGWLDPKLEKFREKKPEEPFVPKDTKELIDVLKRTPKGILSQHEKNMFASIMNLKERRVKDLMILKDDMIFVNDDEFLGPLNLDKLYKSGFSIFPVIDKKGKIIGTIRTDVLNSLEDKEGKKAKKFLDGGRIVYLNENDCVEKVIDEFLKTSSLFYVIKNASDEIVGMVTFDIVVYYLLGKI